MKRIKEYLKEPTTIWKIIVFVFGLGVTWSSLNFRIKSLEEFQKKVDVVEIKTTLSKIQTDIERIKTNLLEK